MKKIILCPNPNRDRGMETTRRADAILRQMGFQTVVCPPFKDQKDGAYGDYKTRPLTAELKSADLLITFGGDGTRFRCWASTWGAWASSRSWRPGSWRPCGS